MCVYCVLTKLTTLNLKKEFDYIIKNILQRNHDLLNIKINFLNQRFLKCAILTIIGND